jgi:hypothetical protein
MGDDLRVEVTNQAAFTAALEKIRRDLAAPHAALEATGRELQAASGPNAPRRTGRLAGSVSVQPAGQTRIRVTADVPYAAPIHWGWPGHGIHRQPWLVATWLRDRAPLDRLTREVQGGIDKAAAAT